MITVKIRDIVRKPSILSQGEPILIMDGTTKKPKSVILPYQLYEKIRELSEAELFLSRNEDFINSRRVAEEFEEHEAAILEDVSD